MLHFYAALFLGSFYKLFRAVGSFFCDWGLSKNVGHNGWPTKKNFKITLTKHPKTVTKKLKFGPGNKFFKTSYLEFTFSFRFSSRMSSQSQQNLAKNITHFTIPFCSKNLTYFTNLNCFNIVKKIFPQHSKKPAHFTKFPANMFLVVVKKKTCTAPFLEAKELHSRTTGKAFLYMSVRSFNLVVG